MRDPWKHRSQGMRCITCMFFVRKIKEGPSPVETDGPGDIGRCRANAPTMKGFPVVFEQDWCGNHRLDEEKI